MPVQLMNPEGLPKPEVYRQVAVATGTRTVYLAGQVAGTRMVRRSARETWPPRSSRPT
jgi:hypothetical protein